MNYGFFFLTDKDRAPRVTVCIKLRETKWVSIGTAICGHTETPEVYFGVVAAKRRADRMHERYMNKTIGKKFIKNESALLALRSCGYKPCGITERLECRPFIPWVLCRNYNLSEMQIENSEMFPSQFKTTLKRMQEHPDSKYCAQFDGYSLCYADFGRFVKELKHNFQTIVKLPRLPEIKAKTQAIDEIKQRIQQLKNDISKLEAMV